LREDELQTRTFSSNRVEVFDEVQLEEPALFIAAAVSALGLDAIQNPREVSPCLEA